MRRGNVVSSGRLAFQIIETSGKISAEIRFRGVAPRPEKSSATPASRCGRRYSRDLLTKQVATVSTIPQGDRKNPRVRAIRADNCRTKNDLLRG